MPFDIDRVTAKDLLSNGSDQFPDAARKWIFPLETFGSPMGASTRPPYIGQRQESANEARQPVVGVGDVMEDVEPVLFVQPSGQKKCLHLPHMVVDLVAALNT